nr:hypothetical protein CFP56_06804 [Quercus suber]
MCQFKIACPMGLGSSVVAWIPGPWPQQAYGPTWDKGIGTMVHTVGLRSMAQVGLGTLVLYNAHEGGNYAPYHRPSWS